MSWCDAYLKSSKIEFKFRRIQPTLVLLLKGNSMVEYSADNREMRVQFSPFQPILLCGSSIPANYVSKIMWLYLKL